MITATLLQQLTDFHTGYLTKAQLRCSVCSKSFRHHGGWQAKKIDDKNYLMYGTVRCQNTLVIRGEIYGDMLETRNQWSSSRVFRHRVLDVAVLHLARYWMGDCFGTGKPSWYMTTTQINSAFHPSGVGKSSTNLLGSG